MMKRTFTHPDVLGRGVREGWAEAETDPTRIDWVSRQATAAYPFQVIGGRPVNPCENTQVWYGRNHMGWWGENLMADAIVTFTSSCTRLLYLLMIEREDGNGWAFPGGHVEPGETGIQAAIRELREETTLIAGPERCTREPARYVPDPRASREAWAVTIPVRIHLGEVNIAISGFPLIEGRDDAARAEWLPAADYSILEHTLSARYRGKIFTAHMDMLHQFLTAPPSRGMKEKR